MNINTKVSKVAFRTGFNANAFIARGLKENQMPIKISTRLIIRTKLSDPICRSTMLVIDRFIGFQGIYRDTRLEGLFGARSWAMVWERSWE